MSTGLVSYGSSDEENSSDEETRSVATGEINSESTDVNRASRGSVLVLPPPKHSNPDDAAKLPETLQFHVGNGGSESKLQFNAMPAPSAALSFVNGHEEVEEEPEMIISAPASEVALAEKPPAKRKIVKIAALSFPIPDSDSDDEVADAGKPKRAKLSTAESKAKANKIGLFALLPPPKTGSASSLLFAPKVLTANKGVPALKSSSTISSARNSINMTPFVPKSVVRFPTAAPATSNSTSSKVKGLASKISDYDMSDEDDVDDDRQNRDLSFFSISDASDVGISAAASIISPQLSANIGEKTLRNSVPQGPALHTNEETVRDEYLHPESSSVSSTDVSTSWITDNSSSWTETSCWGEQTAAGYSGEGYEEYGVGLNPQNDVLHDEQFLRMQGRRNRGEEINFIDVHAGEKPSDVELTKNMTEPVDMHPSSNAKDGPTSQQRRKHQITYLAHQAKEREFQLKNQWAENKFAKRQTQSKYGF